jgi:hypothetical protein
LSCEGHVVEGGVGVDELEEEQLGHHTVLVLRSKREKDKKRREEKRREETLLTLVSVLRRERNVINMPLRE